LDFAPCEITPVIESAADGIRPTAEAKSIKLQMQIEPEVGTVFGDRERLQQVFWNLLANAVKFTPVGGVVNVNLRRVNSHVEISVTDSGAGIRPEFLPYVFDRFRQADGSTTRKHGGLGLGLAIVRHLVELHGGFARADSGGEGKGAKFTITLPLMLAAEGQLGPSETAEKTLAARAMTSLEGLRVLIVDDELDARELVTIMLERGGAQMKSACCSNEGIEIIRTWRPHVLIADIGMPDEDGYGFIKRVRELTDEQGGRTPAVALTAYARAEDRLRALSAGYQRHLSKPVNRVELSAVVAKLAQG
jgi:CheY-like chemotaxis protein